MRGFGTRRPANHPVAQVFNLCLHRRGACATESEFVVF